MKIWQFKEQHQALTEDDRSEAQEFINSFCKGVGSMNMDKWVLLTHLALKKEPLRSRVFQAIGSFLWDAN